MLLLLRVKSENFLGHSFYFNDQLHHQAGSATTRPHFLARSGTKWFLTQNNMAGNKNKILRACGQEL